MNRRDSAVVAPRSSEPTGTGTPASGRAALREHAMAVLIAPVRLRDGRVLPVGTRGAVVFVHGNGAAYEVEFSRPFRAVATVEAAGLEEAAAA